MTSPETVEVQGSDSAAAREIVFVTGMHRSATSAFAGSLALLGGALPARMLDANRFNPKGYFESQAIVAANDRILAEMQRHWNDCRPLTQPEGPQRQDAEDHCARLLRTAFAPGPIVALKDPRMSLLAPVWIDAARRTGARPSFVVMLRDPVASAASIMRRDGLGEEAAIALWLRYMFDAERHTRGSPRIIVCAETFVRDPVATLDRVGAALGLHWPTAPEAARDALTEFLDAALLEAWQDMATPIADFASEAHTALADLTGLHGADESAARARIDALRADFDALCPEIHGRMVFDQLGKAVTRKWEVTDAQQHSRALAAQLDQARAQIEVLIAERDAAAAERDAAAAERDAAVAERDAAVAERHAAAAERDAAVAERDAAVAEREKVQTELARARRRPGKLWRDLVRYRIFAALAQAYPLLPNSMTRRFARSAAKRDPNRSLLCGDVSGVAGAPIGAGAPTAVTADAASPEGPPDAKDEFSRSIEARLDTVIGRVG